MKVRGLINCLQSAGGDGNIGVAVRQPSGTIVHNYAWKPNAEYEEENAIGGYYSVCLDNQFSRFSGKLVNLYMTTFKYDEWEEMAKEIEVSGTLVNGNNISDNHRGIFFSGAGHQGWQHD